MRKIPVLLSLAFLSFHHVQAAPTGSAVKHEVTPAVSALIDSKIRQYTKARCIMSYSFQTFASAPSKGLTSQQLFEKAYTSIVASFNKSKSLGQSFDSGRSGNMFWLISNSQLAGSVFVYSQYDNANLSIYTCKSAF